MKGKNNENMTSMLNSKGPCHASEDEVALAKQIEGESKSTKMISKIKIILTVACLAKR